MDTMRAMQIPLDHPLLQCIVDDLAEKGWSQQNGFLPQALTLELAAECRKRAVEGELAPAAVGRGPAQEIREGIRGDHIQWLEEGDSAVCDRYMAVLDSLRLAINRSLFLGLEDFEGHFAMYPPGAFYLKHGVEHDVVPSGGCLVVFLSGDVPHEVLPATRERLSLTGWFRRRGNEPF